MKRQRAWLALVIVTLAGLLAYFWLSRHDPSKHSIIVLVTLSPDASPVPTRMRFGSTLVSEFPESRSEIWTVDEAEFSKIGSDRTAIEYFEAMTGQEPNGLPTGSDSMDSLAPDTRELVNHYLALEGVVGSRIASRRPQSTTDSILDLAGGGPTALRLRLVELELAFEKTSSSAEVSGLSWSGTAVDGSTVTLDISQEGLSGTVYTQTDVFQIRSLPDGRHLISKVDVGLLPPSHGPATTPRAGTLAAAPPDALLCDGLSAGTLKLAVTIGSDVRETRGTIRTWRTKAEALLQTSNPEWKLQIVGDIPRTTHQEGSVEQQAADASNSRNPLRTIRNALRADVLIHITAKSGFCGKANDQFPIAVLKEKCGNLKYDFIHELGHTLGLLDDTDKTTKPMDKEAHGIATWAVGSIMARPPNENPNWRRQYILSHPKAVAMVAGTSHGLYLKGFSDERAALRRLLDRRRARMSRCGESTPPSRSGSHTVKRGESLSKIAALYFNGRQLWQRLAEANPQLKANPHLIHPNDLIAIP